MYASDSNATTDENAKITINGSSGATSGSAGMYGKLSKASTSNYTILNKGAIEIESVTKNVGIYG